MSKNYETVLGLEIHAELSTNSKLFCNCKVDFGSPANTQTCPICTGMPGVLPVMNDRAVEFTIRAGLAMNCKIASYSKFDRKNYFYPDLPKGYQISQYDHPIAYNGYIDYQLNGELRRTRINRIHLEEDAGKLIHGDLTGNQNLSYVDLNRSSVPLMEIVSEPDIRSPEEAIAYWKAIREILEYIEVSDCNMEEGSFRCDANISLRPIGSEKLGTRTELKNKNSFQHVLAGLQYEIRRQSQILDRGGKIDQVTLRLDTDTGKTSPMRSKEEAHDYRYMPEPDLVPLEIDRSRVKKIQENLPELPFDRRKRFVEELKIPAYDAIVLTATRSMADFFDRTVEASNDAKLSSNWVMGELSALLKENAIEIDACKITPIHLGELIKLIKNGTISGKIAKSVLVDSFESGKMPSEIVEEKGLAQISDSSMLEEIVNKVLGENKRSVEDFRAGKKRAIGFLVGQVMKETRGKANPEMVNNLLVKKLQI